MSKPIKDYQMVLIKLQKQNQDYRDELKLLSTQLDTILKSSQSDPKPEDSPSIQLTIETLTKKISILETELKHLRSKPSQPSDRLSLESQIASLKDSIKQSQSTNKDLKKQIESFEKPEKTENPDTIFADLRTARQKLKKIEEKYAASSKSHSQNQEEIQKLEDQLTKALETHIDILKISSTNASHTTLNVLELKKTLSDLESQKKNQELQVRTDIEKLQLELQTSSERLTSLRKDLKLKLHEISARDHEINDLKRRFRTTSAKRFNNSPDVGQYEEMAKEKPGMNTIKLFAVKSESRIQRDGRRPPRPESNSPAAQRIRILKSELKPNI